MKKTTAIILFLLVLMVPAATFAGTGVGFVLGEPTGLTFKTNNLVVGIGWSFSSGVDNRIDATIDWWLINKDFVEMLNWYLGVGAKVGIKTNQGNDNTDVLGVGIRVPIGVQWWLTNEFELFAEIAPGISLIPDTSFDVGAGIGLRYYF